MRHWQVTADSLKHLVGDKWLVKFERWLLLSLGLSRFDLSDILVEIAGPQAPRVDLLDYARVSLGEPALHL